MSDLATVVSRGVDWVTATATSDHLQQALWNVGEELMEAIREPCGVNLERMELRGYRGWLGGGMFLGKRDDSVMLRGSSNAAREVYRGLYASGQRFTITRLDIQVTGQFTFDNAGHAQEAETQALAALVRAAQVGRRKVSSIRNNGSGDTCSLGSRSSQRYLRCYDKTREQRGQVDENLWRWEVEYKSPLSTKVAEAIALLDEQEPAIVALVADEFQRKGVTVPWVSGEGIEIPTTGVSATDDGRRLVWLNVQVKPVIGKLLQSVGLAATLVALGLESLIPPES